MIGSGTLASRRLAVGLMSTFLIGAGTAAAQQIGTLEATAGQVTVLRLGQPQALSPSMPLQLNDILVTRQGRASVRFLSDGTVLRVGPESRVQIDENATQRDIKLFFGRIWAHVIRWKERPTRFSSGSTIAAIRGTELSLAVATDGNETQLSVLEGKVEAETDAGKLNLQGGQVATGAKGRAPALTLRAKPLDAVQWALYYPPVLYTKPGEPESLTHAASVKLAAGSVEDATKDLDAALKANANDADALALQTIIAVATNRQDAALATAQRAVAADPKSATAQIALSYAHQAKFDLEGARASLEKAVQLDPTDALAWARLAEIRSSLGQGSASLEAANKATALEPNLARTQTVLGFSHLTQVHTGEATAAFRKAIELDSADPLPRLGLGLARIRDGALAEGSKELETAVSLDPGQAIVRSYLGKAYFEQKRTDLVDREYDVAKQSDPNDPTPWLYDAINKQTTNRPVEALEANQKAIELNDNRAVYRSRLLLDSDEAARSASLGRVYSDLGFQDRALVEGWNSVNTDPTNYSAHRFLADSYAVLPRHEIARVSELLQAQLLQPLNLTPVQPQLALSKSFILTGAGPAEPSLNEFNPLFERNRLSVLASGVAGTKSTYGDELVVSGLWDHFAFSVGQFHYETEGFRRNNDLTQNIYDVFAQARLSYQTSVQLEFRAQDTKGGDLLLRFDPDNFRSDLRQTEDLESIRLGLRHAFAPNSILLASFIYHTDDFDTRVGEGVRIGTDVDGYTGELQHLFRSPRFNLVSGAGHFDADRRDRLTFPFFSDTTKAALRHTNLYLYSLLYPVRALALTLGASADFFEGGTRDRKQVNPKVGLTWTPVSSTTLRGAVFRTLKRTLVTNQTLEPTQVGGFNQFFDDDEATDSWRYGVGVDHKFSPDLYAGAEASRRESRIPFTEVTPAGTAVRQADWTEDLGRAYLYWTPTDWLAVSAEYRYERLERDRPLDQGITEARTHRLPLGVAFFHPSGLHARLRGTFVDQSGRFADRVGELQARDDRFWIVDASVGYRLPRRWGLITLEARNLLDERFRFQDTDPANPQIAPERLILLRFTLSY